MQNLKKIYLVLTSLENIHNANHVPNSIKLVVISLQWRHNGRDGVSNHQPHDCLLNRLFRRRSKKISKPRVTTGLCAGNSPENEFPAQMASNAENVSIWWRHWVEKNTAVVWPCLSTVELRNQAALTLPGMATAVITPSDYTEME